MPDSTPQSLDLLEPSRLYSLHDARLFVASRQGGLVCARTLQRAVRDGRLKAHKRGQGWFVWGGDLLAFLQVEKVPVWEGQTPAQRKKIHEDAMKSLRAMGMKV